MSKVVQMKNYYTSIKPKAKAGTDFVCPNCENLIFRLAEDIFEGEQISISQIRQDVGQAPFAPYQRMSCIKCGNDFTFDDIMKQLTLF